MPSLKPFLLFLLSAPCFAQVLLAPKALLAPGDTTGSTSAAQVFFSLAAGTYTGSQTVTLTTSVVGATIFYTTDGTTPTILSTRYSGPLTVASSQTVKAIAAVIYIDGQNQNQNTHVGSGTFHWKAWCYLSGCDPGGSGVPQATSQTFNVVSPVIVGAGNSMSLSMTSSATVNQTNALMTDILSDCTANCTQWAHDFQVQFSCSTFGNLSQSEHDQFWFDNADGYRWMYGMQWNKAGGRWELVGNSNVDWTNSGVTQSMSCGVWNHVQMLTHRVVAEMGTKPCTDKFGAHWPCLYYDQLNINGTVHQLNQAYAANANPTGWTGEGMQHQININAKNATETEYYSQDNFIATGNSTAVVSAAYTIN